MKPVPAGDKSVPSGGPSREAPLLRLTLLCVLLLVARQPIRGLEGGGGSGKVPPLALRPPPRLPRRLLAQAPPEACIATYSEAVFLPPKGPTDGGGSVQFPRRVPTGQQLRAAADHLQPSALACDAACRAIPECNAWWYCSQGGGCTDATYNLTSPAQGCELVAQLLTRPGTGRPVLLVAAPQFVGGAPLRNVPEDIKGYDAYPGLGFWYRYDYACEGSVSQPGSCGLEGGPADAKVACDADPNCQVLMYFPDGRDYPGPGQPVCLLKGGAGSGPLQIEDSNVNLNAVLYKKQGTAASGGGGLSSAAIAGVVVGTCCLAGMLAGGAAYILVRRRRERGRGVVQHDKAAQASSSSTASDASGSKPNDGPDAAVAAWRSCSGAPGGSGGGFSRLDLEGGSRELQLQPSSSGCSPGMAPSSEASTLGGMLPLGPERSVPDGAGLAGRQVPSQRPHVPPPSITASFAAARRLPKLAAPAAGASPPAQPVLASGSPTADAGVHPATCADARAAKPMAGGGFHPLLSQLPTYGWQRSLVDHTAIQFVRDRDGALVELGSGASATVFKVLLNGVEPHAAKVFRIGSDPQAQLYFLEEAGLLRLLRHRCIVGFAGVCVAAGDGIILMELMEGGDLRAHNAALDPVGRRIFGWYQRGRTVALDVATAILYLHTQSYTHFDVKSRNVLLSRDLTAKLADVGFTRAMRATHHSIEGPTGTFDYMAPELLNGRKCTSSVDIYSFGILLWEIATGKYPVRGCMREPRVPQECPAEAAQLIAACLQEDPTAWPTSRQLVERLTAMQ